ncbi:tautomerase family protein [Actinomycetospora endophytica]|uniref:Tautomerase family protein n=1 Tax=Actinomycetospora endophytica TaxID=2291215 RepID=A0ABS8P135_9PSEU|nr:tautomerase family protein [Actinomycetospora endophytica]MCD2191956.1 tautomerase family protein [Actinomycetospora endophytica]
MPVYQVVTSGVELTEEQRDALATRFTDTHHEVTGAPDPFVRIVFQPLPLGLMYTAGRVEPSLILSAGCRGGRSEQTRHELMTKLYEVIQDVVGLPADQVVVVVSDTPSSWIIEAGMVLPEPTHDAEALWMKKLDEMFPGKYQQYV